MREHWDLPEEDLFRFTGPDWLLILLDRCSAPVRDQVKLVLWKAWAIHNNITHQSGPTGIYDGVYALYAMQTSLLEVSPKNCSVSDKGKEPAPVHADRNHCCVAKKEQMKTVWNPLPLTGSRSM